MGEDNRSAIERGSSPLFATEQMNAEREWDWRDAIERANEAVWVSGESWTQQRLHVTA